MLIDDDLVPVRHSDIVLGKPLPWPVYDAHRNLLLNKGVTVTSLSQVDGLIKRGLFRNRDFGCRRSAAEVPEVVDDAGGAETDESLPFEDLRLMPGDVLQLQPLLEGAAERYGVRMLGYARGRSILAAAPEVEGRLVHLRDGQTFQVRVFSGRNIGIFTTRVLKSQLTPYPYVHLAYPNSVKAMRLRTSMRAPVSLVAALYDKEDGTQLGAGVITDISIGGARVEIPKIMGRKGASLFLSFKVKLPDIEEYVRTSSIIRSVTEGRDEADKPHYVHGLQFDKLAPHYQLVIMNLVYRHLYKDAV